MNISENIAHESGYEVIFTTIQSILERLFGSCESLFSYETLQFEDYSKIVFSYCDPAERIERRKTVFPKDCEQAYSLGQRLVRKN